MKRAIHFGAGNIGRGFIGLLLHRAGYHVAFVDVDANLVQTINTRGHYSVRLAAADPQPETVDNISAISGVDAKAVAAAIGTADIVTTAVGPQILKRVAPTIALGLQGRSVNAPRLTIIACENLIGASAILREHVKESLPGEMQANLDKLAVFANCAVDRIVPLQRPDSTDPLAVTVEPFFEWVVDASAFAQAERPPIPGVHFVENLQPYIERKLFTVNTGHCCLAYLGYRAGIKTIHEAMADGKIRAVVEGALKESGAGIVAKHHVPAEAHQKYIAKILERFANPFLADEIVRVGRSVLRKLSPTDRLIAPARLALDAKVFPENLARVIAAALRYDHSGDPEAVSLQASIRELGAAEALSKSTGLPASDGLHKRVLEYYEGR